MTTPQAKAQDGAKKSSSTPPPVPPRPKRPSWIPPRTGLFARCATLDAAKKTATEWLKDFSAELDLRHQHYLTTQLLMLVMESPRYVDMPDDDRRDLNDHIQEIIYKAECIDMLYGDVE